MPPIVATGRDLRLDLFRGLALWLIFLDHIPSEHRELGHDPQLRLQRRRRDLRLHLRLHGGLRLWPGDAGARRSSWRARASSSAPGRSMSRISSSSSSSWRRSPMSRASFDNPLYAEEMRRLRFSAAAGRHADPGAAAQVQAELHGRAAALYRAAARLSAGALAAAARGRRSRLLLRPRSTPPCSISTGTCPPIRAGTWFFNPLAWQLIFVFGAWCALGGVEQVGKLLRSRIVVGLAVAYLVFAFLRGHDLVFPALRFLIPKCVSGLDVSDRQDQPGCAALRAFPGAGGRDRHFIPSDWPGLKSHWLRPMILCGQHSLEIFCLGIFLSFIGHFVTSRNFPIGRDADIDQRVRDSGDGWRCVADFVVQDYRGARFRESSEAAGGRPRGRRGMKSHCRGSA